MPQNPRGALWSPDDLRVVVAYTSLPRGHLALRLQGARDALALPVVKCTPVFLEPWRRLDFDPGFDIVDCLMPTVKSYPAGDLSNSQVRAIFELLNRVWVPENATIEEQVANFPRAGRTHLRRETVFVAWDGDAAIAHAATFGRIVITSAGPISVLALASVCSHPDWRGQGLGKQVVEAVFASIQSTDSSVCLFQTGVPDFYLKLGARRVLNRFTNSQDLDNSRRSPWWEPHVMIYPATAPWPSGPIDLNGAAY